jgi:hypothetical protein
MMKPRHEKNIWKDRAKYLARQTKPHKLMSGAPPLTVTNITFGDETSTMDHIGQTVVLTQYVFYSGNWDTVYIQSNASALGLPWNGDYAAGSGGFLYCSNTAIKWMGGLANSSTQPARFDYVSTFSPLTPERFDLAPLDRPPQFEFGGTDLTEVRRIDCNGDAMVNSTGDYYEGLPEFYVPGFEVNLIYNFDAAHNPSDIIQNNSWTTNTSTWNGQAAFSGAIGKINAVETWETYQGLQVKYWRMTVPMRFRTDGNGWTFAPFDYGYRYLKSGVVTNYVDSATGVYGPVFLDGSGGLLGGDGTTRTVDPVIYPPASGGNPAGYQILTPTDWSGASFPNPFA